MTLTKSKPLQQYTDRAEFDSSAVYEAFYDDDSQRLFVVLTSGKVCGYEGVSRSLWEDFLDSTSAGRFWNKEIKRNRNLRKLSGDVDFFEREKIEIDESAFTSVFSPSAFTPSELFVPKADPGTNGSPITQPDRVFLVTVAVQAQSLAVAVNDVASQGLEVVAVNPA